jgi:SRSO17 transposase
MLQEHGAVLPHAWVTGDDEMGRNSYFREQLRGMNEQYLLDVPANTLVRDLNTAPPAYSGRGQPPKAPFQRADRWLKAAKAKAWTTIEVRAGEKGPVVVEAIKTRVQAKLGRRNGPEEILVVFRERQQDKTIKHDYCLSNAPFKTPLREFARAFKAERRIEECIKRAKSEAGLADYEVRTWIGWHHHQTLALIATWFLTQEKRRGEKIRSVFVRPRGSHHSRPIAA